MAELLAELLDTARAGVRVTLESSVLPPVTVYGGEKTEPGPGVVSSVAGLLGIRGGLVVRNAQGAILARVGDPAPFSAARLVVLLAVLGVLGYGLTLALRRQ